MDIPKPHPPTQPLAVKTAAKKPYEMKPHLTDKPFRNDPALAELKENLKKAGDQ